MEAGECDNSREGVNESDMEGLLDIEAPTPETDDVKD